MIDDDAPAVESWTGELKALMYAVRPERPLAKACGIEILVYVKRPKSHFGSGRKAGDLKARAPTTPATGHDLDKVARAVLDCVSAAGWWEDDARAATLAVHRCYVDSHGERTVVRVWEMKGPLEVEERRGAAAEATTGVERTL